MIFDSTWRKSCAVSACSISEVNHFIAAHYLHKRPAICVLCLMMLKDGQPVGCVVYSLPPRETCARYGGVTWELARLYLLDEIPKNAETWLIGRSVRFIKQHHPEVRFLISYADPSAGHAGTIYKAANWIADGKTDDERKSPRFDLVDAVTGKKYGRASHVPQGAEVRRLPRVSKHRFYLKL